MKKLYISQSAIKDFLACKKRYYYRLNFKNESIPTKEMFLGTLAHKLLEDFDNDKLKAIQQVYRLEQQHDLSRVDTDILLYSIDGFYDSFYHLVTPDDKKEVIFSIPYNEGVYLVGKFDRITPNHMVIDWKSGRYVPLTLKNDIQSILYHYAYKQLYDVEPSVVMAYLRMNKMSVYLEDKTYIDILFNEILPDMLDNIWLGDFPHTGLFKNSCRNCSFKEYCFKQLSL